MVARAALPGRCRGAAPAAPDLNEHSLTRQLQQLGYTPSRHRPLLQTFACVCPVVEKCPYPEPCPYPCKVKRTCDGERRGWVADPQPLPLPHLVGVVGVGVGVCGVWVGWGGVGGWGGGGRGGLGQNPASCAAALPAERRELHRDEA